ncbi:MAG: nucleotide exchange factor GrpE [Eubacteriales bacterium]|jgi:molecular chaperone GrpE|nr:nucleotide exchange factor GrpE [Eubacteriales bacterium]MDO5585571.1 nucleotide exchange factor GrpE [Clostridia bacterium]MDY4213787.1 nucleotide exchange factor GrpE [Eubacteriales bacterium]MDY5231778.1 nucleotide exchange factor GrpE [Eubacteriales bacterium]
MAKNKTNGKTAPSEEEIKDAVETVEDTEDTTAVENPKNADESEDSKDSEKSELDKANEQIAALSDKLIRNAAEFDNYKKRTAREKEDFYKSAVCETVAPLLPVLDNLERAVAAAEDSGESGSVLDGVKMVKKQFEDALKSIGVEPIEAVGEQFDPEKHNAVMTADSDEDENTVLEEFQKGYIYRDKVVRHSMVKVSN